MQTSHLFDILGCLANLSLFGINCEPNPLTVCDNNALSGFIELQEVREMHSGYCCLRFASKNELRV